MGAPRTIGDLIREKLAGSPGAIKLEREASPATAPADDWEEPIDEEEFPDGVEPECVDPDEHDAGLCCCFNCPVERIDWG